MGKPGAEIIALMIDEYLCLVFQAAKCPRMQYPVTVTLKWGAATEINIAFTLVKLTPARSGAVTGKSS